MNMLKSLWFNNGCKKYGGDHQISNSLKKESLLCYNQIAITYTQKGDSMIYDTIKFLNLEDIADKIDDIKVTKVDDILNFIITLKINDDRCPSCGSKNITVHDYRSKKIKHSISTVSDCYLIYKARRYKCKICNCVFYEFNPFSKKGSQTSTYTILSVLNSLRSHTATFTSVAEQYNLTKQNVMNIFDEYVDCKRKKLSKIISIDEFYIARISSTKYACTFLNFETKEIIEVYSSRHYYDLANRMTSISEEERNNVEAVVIDMWDSYKNLAKIYFKKAIIAVDSFHVIKHLNDAIIKIRLKIMNKYNKKTNKLVSNDMYYYMLKKFHYFFVKNYEDIYDGYIKIQKMKTKWKKDEILKYLLSIDNDLKYAYLLKEKYREFNLTAKFETCESELISLINEFLNSHLEEYRIFGGMLYHWKEEIINSFKRIDGRRLSNGAIEGVNSRIKTIIKNANGYNNFGRLRNRIIFSINKNEPIINKK